MDAVRIDILTVSTELERPPENGQLYHYHGHDLPRFYYVRLV